MQLPRDAAAGLRQGGIFGLAEEDIDFDFDEMVIHVRRQVKKLGKYFVFALPKSDMERTVPMSEGTALTLRAHIDATGPRPYTLPWERLDGPPMTVRILFRWTDDRHSGHGGTTSRCGSLPLRARKAIDSRLSPLFSIAAHGRATEQATSGS